MFKCNEVPPTTAFLRVLAGRSGRSLAAIIGVGLIFSTPASATLTSFGQFSEFANGFAVTNSGTSETITMTSQSVTFEFTSLDGTLPAALSGPQAATFTLSAITTTPAVLNGSTLTQGGFSGNFSITRNTPTSDGFSNLLSGTFGPNLTLAGPIGGSSSTFSAPTETQVVFSSDFIAISGPLMEELEFSLSGASQGLGFGAGNFLNSFGAAPVGVFEADPDPDISPEPGSIVSTGAGLLGLAWFVSRRQLARKAR